MIIADKGKPIYQNAFGYADREKKIKNSVNTLFDIGSMNKTFTKVVICQLVAEGKLRFADKLGRYITGFQDSRAKHITIEQLLNHESGMGDYHDRDYFELSPEKRTRDYIKKKILAMHLLFAPGEGNEYSNSGYVMLGSVIEKITGKSYYQNIRDRISIPLGLKNTYLEDLGRYRHLRATSYYKTPFGELHSNDNFIDVANADGGFLSTVEDIMKFYRSYYYDDVLISEKMKKEDSEFKFLRSLPTGRAPMAAGGYDGFNTAMYQVFQDDVSIIVFSNMDEPAGEKLASGILDLTRGEKAPEPSLPAMMNIVNAYQEKGIDYIKTNFPELIINYHPSDPKEWILNDLGYAYLYEKNDLDAAKDMFQLNTEIFPENANTWDSLGEVWLKKGDKSKALQYYQKALDLDPELVSAQKAVKKIREKK